MEAENQFLSAFQQLLNTQPELFKDSERRELEALIASLPNDIEQLADAIVRWVASHSEINNALMALIASQPSKERGGFGTFPDPNNKSEDDKNQQQTLLNALRKSSIPNNPKPKTPKGS